jgi:hypothetical protein
MSLSTFRHLVTFVELATAFMGTIYFYKYKHTHLKYFLYLLWYTTLTEFTGWYATKNKVLVFSDTEGVLYNLWLFNILSFITFNTLFYIYFTSLKNKKFKKWVKIFSISYIFIYAVNWLFIQDFLYEWSELPYVTGSLFLIVLIIFYFIELMRLEEVIIYHKKLLFWISIGLLLFYTGNIPFSIEITKYALLKGIHNLFLIVWILALLMYLVFAFGFIWSDKDEIE